MEIKETVKRQLQKRASVVAVLHVTTTAMDTVYLEEGLS